MAKELSSSQGRELDSTVENILAAERIAAFSASACDEVRMAAKALSLPMPSQELCERVRRAVVAAAERDAESMEALRLTVCEFTTALRQEGATPEAALIALKTLVKGGSGAHPIVGRSFMDWSGHLLREKMSTWCIEEYFRDATPGPTQTNTK